MQRTAQVHIAARISAVISECLSHTVQFCVWRPPSKLLRLACRLQWPVEGCERRKQITTAVASHAAGERSLLCCQPSVLPLLLSMRHTGLTCPVLTCHPVHRHRARCMLGRRAGSRRPAPRARPSCSTRRCRAAWPTSGARSCRSSPSGLRQSPPHQRGSPRRSPPSPARTARRRATCRRQ